MKPCEQPCLDCPFRRDSTPDEKFGWDFIGLHFWGEWDSNPRDPEIYTCEEQGGICIGQLKLLANNNQTIMVDPFGDWYDLIDATEVDREEYFWHPQEMRRYHESGGEIYGENWYWDRYGRGNKRQKHVAVVAGTQLTFKDWKNGS